ncbi:unnamed protein product [Rhizoctonia solani]|uniref:C2H2-type domain-containing protein n=1 Tax=Rhizoctonia solani TaxID=456999 RepID=A0A8H3GNX5_9AGAM|nr:unnamed protein product [Rhizoctonia solani]
MVSPFAPCPTSMSGATTLAIMSPFSSRPSSVPRWDRLKAKFSSTRSVSEDVAVAQLDALEGRIEPGSHATRKDAFVFRFTFKPFKFPDRGAKHEPTEYEPKVSIRPWNTKKSQARPENPNNSKGNGGVDKSLDELIASRDAKHASTTPSSGDRCNKEGAKNETQSQDVTSDSLRHGDQVGVSKATSLPTSSIITPGQVRSIPNTRAQQPETSGFSQSECSDSAAALSGANINTERGHSGTNPTKPKVALPEQVKENDADPLNYLTILFGHTTLEDSEDGLGCPKSALSKGGDNKHCFYALSGLYYFDNFKNVFSQDGTLIRDALFDFRSGSLLDPSFDIDGMPYWFEGDDLLSQGIGGAPYRVQTSPLEEEPALARLDAYLTFGRLQTSPGDMTASQSNFDHWLGSDPEPISSPMPISHGQLNAPDSMLIEKGGQDSPQVPLANSPGVKLNNPTSSNPAVKRKRLEDELLRLFSTETNTVASLIGGSEFISSGVIQTSSATNDSGDTANSTITPQLTLLKPQQHLSPKDLRTTPAPTPEAGTKYRFCASDELYYFDRHQKLYSEDGRLAYDGSSGFQADAASPNFKIAGVPYWFGPDCSLWRRDTSGTRRRVRAVPVKWDPLDPYSLSTSQRATPQPDAANLQVNSSPGSYVSKSTPTPMPPPDRYCDTLKGKVHTPSPDVNSNSLQRGFQTGLVARSPAFSSIQSPDTKSISNTWPISEGPPLFATTEPSVTRGSKSISTLLHSIMEPQGGGEDGQPAKKRKRGDPIVCHICGAEWRRPVALREHLRTHTGEKRKYSDPAFH